MKRILGLDLGTTSIGWAYVLEAENKNEQSNILRTGVRVNPLSTDEQSDFQKGKSITINADRTLKRGMRRNLDRYQDRRADLIKYLTEIGYIDSDTPLAEVGKNTTHQTFQLRSKAAKEKIEKDEFARVLLTINKKRGYKSSRKAKDEDEGQAIDGMAIAKRLYDESLTPGQLCLELLNDMKKVLPDFYRSDLQAEFDAIWKYQRENYPSLLTEDLKTQLHGKSKGQTWKICEEELDLKGIKRQTAGFQLKLENFQWRSNAISEAMGLEELAIVLQEINNEIYKSSGYLGAISDRSKELWFNKETVGQYLARRLEENSHFRTKNQVFYRQDYLDEFEKIWETQKAFYPELTNKKKEEIRDIVIFYQRKLKSQKGLISFCEFESQKKTVMIDGKPKEKIIGSRTIPKSSPLFQEFKIWQNLAHVEFTNNETKEKFSLNEEQREELYQELNIKGNLTANEVLKILVDHPKKWQLNFTSIEGNRTNQALYEAYEKIFHLEGNDDFIFKKMSAENAKSVVMEMFSALEIDTRILSFDANVAPAELHKQPAFQLWHLLYSYEGDDSNSGNETLYLLLEEKFNFKKPYGQILANVPFQDDYGSLSSKAISKILPFLKEHKYNEACSLAGYNHSNSITKEENDKRELKKHLELLPKNSLRNPVVEKILNQLVNVVNAIVDDPELGSPDEIRVELARELKKNAKERAEMTSSINKATAEHEKYREILRNQFNIQHPTRNDLIRYKLYLELESRGFKTIYSETYIPREKLFSKEYDIEHIIPKAKLFDDSFSNKTLAVRDVNLRKGEQTAIDFMETEVGEERLPKYIDRVETLYKGGHISKAKYKKLLMPATEIGEGFIERDLRESQYIAKKASQMLQEIARTVTATSGKITDRLRQDWDLINVMKELNIDKYRQLGLIEIITNKDGQQKEQIKDWTKRNDHRHHAMDALTVAFTKPSHIQYLNNLSARKNEQHKKHSVIHAIEQKETHKNSSDKRVFNSPLPQFRIQAKKHLEATLISFKAKNKVVTRNINKIKTKTGTTKKVELTPRGQLHKETIYGSIKVPLIKEVKVGTKFDQQMIEKVTKPKYREALLKRLIEYQNNTKKAFGGKNSPNKNPIMVDEHPLPEKVTIREWEIQYTIRKEIGPDLKIDKVIDKGTQVILQKRLDAFGGKAKEAFTNLQENPIWINKDKGLELKRVTISGISNAQALHIKRDHLGQPILDTEGNEILTDFVSSGNNHHVAIYKDEYGNLQEEVVSLFDAVERVNAGLPIIFKEHPEYPDWIFQFTMKQNEMFIFPGEDFNPYDIDLLDPKNYEMISPHLFRVQKIGSRDYWFRHQFETQLLDNNLAKNTTWKRLKSTKGLSQIIKVRINHIGKIVHLGEY